MIVLWDGLIIVIFLLCKGEVIFILIMIFFFLGKIMFKKVVRILVDIFLVDYSELEESFVYIIFIVFELGWWVLNECDCFFEFFDFCWMKGL